MQHIHKYRNVCCRCLQMASYTEPFNVTQQTPKRLYGQRSEFMRNCIDPSARKAHAICLLQVMLYICLYSDWLRAGRSGDRIPVGARFFAHVQTRPGTHPDSYTMGTGSFPVVKWPGRGVDTHPHVAPMLKKEYSYTSIPLLALRSQL
jgi:hypothetical protein